MTHRCRAPGPLAVLIAVGLTVAPLSPAAGEVPESIPTSIVTADSLDDEQRQHVAAYVTGWSERLLTDDHAAIGTARGRLVEPLRHPAGPSSEFLEAYAVPLVAELGQALEAELWFTRLNTMIVVADLPPATALPLIEQATQDDNAAVRYWAMKAVHRIGQRYGWPADQHSALLEMLTRMLREERASLVVGQVMQSLVDLEIQDALDQTLAALNHRARQHHAEPGEPLDPERAGLEELARRLIAGDASDAGLTTQDLRELARTAYRYMRLAATALDEGVVAERHRPAYHGLIRIADRLLQETHDELNAPQSPPSQVGQDVQREDWPAVLVKADRWDSILREPPFNFTEDDLTLRD